MIQPTIGRIVHYLEGTNGSINSTLPAIVTAVHSERCVDLVIFGMVGAPVWKINSVRLVQPGDSDGAKLPYCEWMPYQVKKDHGSESGEKDAGSESI